MKIKETEFSSVFIFVVVGLFVSRDWKLKPKQQVYYYVIGKVVVCCFVRVSPLDKASVWLMRTKKKKRKEIAFSSFALCLFVLEI